MTRFERHEQDCPAGLRNLKMSHGGHELKQLKDLCQDKEKFVRLEEFNHCPTPKGLETAQKRSVRVHGDFEKEKKQLPGCKMK